MGKKGNNSGKGKNSTIGSVIAILIIILIAIFGKNTDISNMLTSAANDNVVTSSETSGNVTTDTIADLSNVTVTTGNDCVTTIPSDSKLRVYCLDVGQGDSILISNNGVNMLIDASTNEMGSTVVNYLKKLGVSKIDYLIGTHPHEDHIGGLDNVIKTFDIGTIYMPKVSTNTKTFEEVIDCISDKGLKVTTPKVGDKFNVGNAECEVMYIGTSTSNYNEDSIVIKMDFDGVSYLFTGDANNNVESSRSWPQVDILKVGHHGSSTSSSESFLKQIKPKIALISVGEGNTYGHPTEAALKRLTNIGAKIYRTDENETILITEE